MLLLVKTLLENIWILYALITKVGSSIFEKKSLIFVLDKNLKYSISLILQNSFRTGKFDSIGSTQTSFMLYCVK